MILFIKSVFFPPKLSFMQKIANFCKFGKLENLQKKEFVPGKKNASKHLSKVRGWKICRWLPAVLFIYFSKLSHLTPKFIRRLHADSDFPQSTLENLGIAIFFSTNRIVELKLIQTTHLNESQLRTGICLSPALFLAYTERDSIGWGVFLYKPL